ncbi:RICIN domain-containing protein [Streptomyces sp. NBC_01619]|uniref:RICIN domain-containing protein n=1 Tax=Streptomyces sp. NBC_01619 TaxID=2975901 RepID=UPI00225B4244|nr:RICIN domain-containing protein [Streptomyces sp. NBC_01619]MCX4515511.1 RICIN domain-containing protein [Streptomyces sp. NBC_01619]
MPELHHRAGPAHADGQPDYSGLSDAELTERIRSGAPQAHPAVQELKRRHLPAVLAYARLCGRNQTAGTQLALQALRLASEEACRGIEPRGQWRHHLLTLVQRVGAAWAVSSRRDRLAPDFASWIDETAQSTATAQTTTTAQSTTTATGAATGTATAGEPGPGSAAPRRRPSEASSDTSSAMLAGFYRLPALTRGVVWYAVVDQEPDATVATCVGVRPDLVADLRAKAPESLRRAFLQAYLERGDRKCLGYRRIIEAAARPGDRRHSGDLTLHLAECPRCTRLVAELTRMVDDPRPVFAEHLLGWRGAEYTTRLPVPGQAGTASARIPGPATTSGTGPPGPRNRLGAGVTGFLGGSRTWQGDATTADGARRPSRSAVLVAAAVAAATVTVVTGTVLVAASGDPEPSRAAVALPTAAVVPPIASASPPAAPSAAPTRQPSQRPTRSPGPTTSAPSPERPAPTPSKSVPPRPVPIVPGAGHHPVVNADTGLCLDIEDGIMANRTDVITTRCNGARTQQWSLEPGGLLRSGADPDYCLDSRGDTDRGAGIWSCASVDGKNGLNLLFTVDASGAVRPRIAPDFALEPLGSSEGSSLGFDPADGDSDQRWNAGTAR